MLTEQSLFWDDLAEDLEDPEFLRTYIGESMRIATVDAIVNALDDARERRAVSEPLLEGRSADTKGLARHLTEVRKPKPRSHMKTSA